MTTFKGLLRLQTYTRNM